MRRLEVIVWCALALAVAVLAQLHMGRAPLIAPDSCQYLNAAQHLHVDHRMETSLVHFDTERSHGAIPAPLTWFPPGYPLAIAALSVTGCGYETAALWMSMVSFVLVTAGIWQLARLLDPSLWIARAAVLCWIVNSQAIAFSIAALSESLFTLVGLGSLLLLLRAIETKTGVYWIGSAAVAAISYWVRYAGIVWIAAFLLVLFVQFVFRRKDAPSWRAAILAVASIIVIVAPLMVRNMILVGDWRGGNNTPFAMPLRELAVGSVTVPFHLVFGDATVSQLRLPIALAAIGLIGICLVALAGTARPPAPARTSSIGTVLSVAIVYLAAIAVIALRSVISFEPRMYLPVLPHLIVLAAIGLAFLFRRAGLTLITGLLFGCLIFGYGMANFISLGARSPDRVRDTENALLEPDGTGQSMQQDLIHELKAGEVIAATNGQMAGYILKHPTLSLVGRPSARVTWDEQRLRSQMDHYGARHLLVFRDAALDPLVEDSPFFRSLADGKPPSWLTLVDSNRGVRLYRVQEIR